MSVLEVRLRNITSNLPKVTPRRDGTRMGASASQAFALSWIAWCTQASVERANVLESDGPRFELQLSYSLVICHWGFLKSIP